MTAQFGRAPRAPAHPSRPVGHRLFAHRASVYALGIACFLTGPQSTRAQILTVDTSVEAELTMGRLTSPIAVTSAGWASAVVLVEEPTGTVVTFFLSDGVGQRRIDAALPRVIKPIAITDVVGSKSVFVLDSWGPALVRVDVSNDGTVTSRPPARLPLSGATDLCTSENRLFVLGADSPVPSSIIHEFTFDYEYVRSFGDPWPAVSGTGQQAAYAAGRIGCNALGEWIVAASLLHPDVRGYSVDGNLMWSVPVPDFLGMTVEFQEPAGILYKPPDDGRWDRVIGVLPLSARMVAVQVGRSLGVDARDGFVNIGTHFVTVHDGRLLGFQTDLPHFAELSVDRALAIVYPGGREEGTNLLMRRYEDVGRWR